MTDSIAEMGNAPVIVVGMHRSGTSLLTGSLEAAGVHLGPVNHGAPHNRKGNKEHEGIRRLNDAIMARYGADWKAPPHLHVPLHWTNEEFAQGRQETQGLVEYGKVWGFKDPRTIWTLEGWLELFPAARLIGVFRHPVAVCNSLMSRPGSLNLSQQAAFTLWEHTNRRLLSLQARLGFPLLHFSQRDLAAHFMEPLAKFTQQIGLEASPASFFEGELVNQKAEDVPAPDDLRSLFEELMSVRNQH